MGNLMSRKSFIESQGATCRNWTWSWSFVNHEKKFVIFGAWDNHTQGSLSKILSEDWKLSSSGRTNPAYGQSLEHISLINEKKYKLFTFPIFFSGELQDEHGQGPARISGFESTLTRKYLTKAGGNWYASPNQNWHASKNDNQPLLAEEIIAPGEFIEGATKKISINAFERSRKARVECIKEYGAVCAGCGFDFGKKYGKIGEGFIHVHHKVPLSNINNEYKLNPITDLIPVCANCHAMIHQTQPVMSIEELKKCIESEDNP
jgi:5-methylcytosine-specific restriction protein A